MPEVSCTVECTTVIFVFGVKFFENEMVEIIEVAR